MPIIDERLVDLGDVDPRLIENFNRILAALDEAAATIPAVPTPTAEDAGSILGVNAEGEYELVAPEDEN